MSQTKAQLIQPIGVVTASGVVVSGVMTAGTFDGDIVGSATSIIQGTNLNLGAFNASSFAGDFTGNATGIITSSAIKVGQLTASSFVGDFTGTATSMFKGTGFEAGAVTGSAFVANVTGNVTGNATGLAGSVTQGTNVHVGVVTATSLYGDGSNLTGIAATNYNTQTVTADGAATTIDLSAGNTITFNQSANTTVSLANTSEAMSVTLIRVKDANDTARTITWPSSITWNGGSAPTLISNAVSGDKQQFKFITRDSGVTWYAWEDYKRDESIGLFVMGGNAEGQLGLNDAIQRSSPTQLPGTTWAYVEIGSSNDNAMMGRKTDGTLWAWGNSANGQTALNWGPQSKRDSSPVQVGTDTTWAHFSLGNAQGCGVKTNGTLWMWGENGYGQLGFNATSQGVSSPMQLGTETTWDSGAKKTISGTRQYGAIKTNGQLWVWGSNNAGRLGVNVKQPSVGYYSSPMQIPGTSWSKLTLTAGWAAIRTDGTLWISGNGAGSQGRNDTVTRSSPTQLPGTWIDIASNTESSGFVGIKDDNTLWSWGYNESGALGQNTNWPGGLKAVSSPVQLPGTDWSEVEDGKRGFSAMKTDGSIWMWSLNHSGMLGQNDRTDHSSPTQVSGTWSDIIQSGYYSRAAWKKTY